MDEDIFEIVSQAIFAGAEFNIRTEAANRATRGEISSFLLTNIFKREGQMHDMSARKLVANLE